MQILNKKHPLQFPGEGVSHDPHLQENGSGFDDALESVGLGRREAVEAFEGDEDFVGAGVCEAEVAEGHARGGIGDGTGFHGRSLVGSKDFQIAVIGIETAVSATGDFPDHLDLCQLGKGCGGRGRRQLCGQGKGRDGRHWLCFHALMDEQARARGAAHLRNADSVFLEECQGLLDVRCCPFRDVANSLEKEIEP